MLKVLCPHGVVNQVFIEEANARHYHRVAEMDRIMREFSEAFQKAHAVFLDSTCGELIREIRAEIQSEARSAKAKP